MEKDGRKVGLRTQLRFGNLVTLIQEEEKGREKAPGTVQAGRFRNSAQHATHKQVSLN